MNVRSSQSLTLHRVRVYQTDHYSQSVSRVEGIQGSNGQKQRIREKLRDILLMLDVSGFEQCISHLLHALEYDEVKIMRSPDANRRSHKGRNTHGGFDLSACSSAFSSPLTLIQVKQYERPVSRRFVDELRGAMLRHGAPQGLLITTSTFPTNAQFSAQENQLLPIHLIDGEQLVDFLVHYRIGIRCKERINKKGKRRLVWRLERQFFRDLQRMA